MPLETVTNRESLLRIRATRSSPQEAKGTTAMTTLQTVHKYTKLTATDDAASMPLSVKPACDARTSEVIALAHERYGAKPVPAILISKDAAIYLGVKEKTLRNWRSAGRGPSYRIEMGRVKYKKADLDRWIEQVTIYVELKAA